MKKTIPLPLAIAIIVVCVGLAGLIVWRYGLIPCSKPSGPTPTPPEDETTDCLEKYPVVVFEDCVSGEVVDGWWGTILYPNTLDTSNIEHYIDAPAPDVVKQAGIACYGASRSTCQTTWFIKINGEWKEVDQVEFCNHIINYNSSCDNCLLEWIEGCC